MMRMSWSRSSSWIGIALIVGLVSALLVGTVAAAPQVEQQSGPGDEGAEAGTGVEATFVVTEPFDGVSQNSWTLNASTDLKNADWTITTRDSSGSAINTFESGEAEISSNVAEIEVVVSGTVPSVSSFNYAEEKPPEQFKLVGLAQKSGGLGEFSTANRYHYTTGSGDDVGSKQARAELDAAWKAIEDAEAAGADVSGAKQTFKSAKSSYNEEAFKTARNDAQRAKQQAEDAAGSAKLKTYGLIGLAVLVLGGGGIGGFYWYREQQGPADPLG